MMLLRAISAEACVEAFVAALIGRDLEAALALLTDDVVLLYSNGSAVWGKSQFADLMSANWKLVDRYEYRTLNSVWTGKCETVAAVAYSFAWSGVANGKDVSGGGRGTRVLRRDPDSGWRISHEHLSIGQWKSG